MTPDAKIAAAVLVKVLFVRRLVQTVTGQAIQGAAVAWIQYSFTERVSDGVLV